MEMNNNSLFLNEKTTEILSKIEKLRDKNQNIFLLNLWKNFIINKRESYLQTLHECEQFVNKIEREACPNNLAPTTSTSMQLLIGDLIAICLMSIKEFKSEDFALYHPSGSLGKKLTLKVSDILNYNSSPKVEINSSIKDAINEISSKMYGATAVLDKNFVVGIITDGDLRRLLNKPPKERALNKIVRNYPLVINESMPATKALAIMNEKKITSLLVVSDKHFAKKNKKLKGIIHIHFLLGEGIR